MSIEPTYPADAVPGRITPTKPKEPVVSVHPAPVEPTPADTAKPVSWQKVGVGIGIGSAAVAAALLYANRSRKGW